MKSLLIGLFTILAFAPNAYAANIIYDESSQGDFSNDSLNPTKLKLSVGSNLITGSTTGNPNLDRDFFYFTIPSGYKLEKLNLVDYIGLDDDGLNEGFLALQAGSQIEPGTVSGNNPPLLSAVLIGALPGREVGDNLLTYLSQPDAIQGSSFLGFPNDILTPGTYTFWIQETRNGIKKYELDFVVSQVPEPSTMLGMSIALGCGMLIKRKRLLVK